MNFDHLINERVVMTCKNNISYAGEFKGKITANGEREYFMVELDEESGFSVLSPIDFIESLIKVPINRD